MKRGYWIVTGLIILGLAAVVTGWFLYAASENHERKPAVDIPDPGERSFPSLFTALRDKDKPCEAQAAVIGDYGHVGKPEEDVASLVHSWQPDLIITTGDNNYPNGEASTIDANIGQYYHKYIGSYTGRYGIGAATNRFFPALGNHDWHTAGAQPYLDYFLLPGNERYYQQQWGPIDMFVIDSSPTEPDGITATSKQAQWLKARMQASELPWQIVVMHHAPYSSSSTHGSVVELQWPYEDWGADLVLAGHDHVYERLTIGEIPYVVNGLGGRSQYGFGVTLPESKVRFQEDFGALKLTATETTLVGKFYTRENVLVDSFTVTRTGDAPCGAML